jgi:uncharacterized tellurite resistance protein B-like protein
MFFKKKENENQLENFIEITALLIHAAKIDENFSLDEEEIIKKTLIKLGAEKDQLKNILEKAKKIEENSNQILLFTKKVKSMDDKKKVQIIEALWQIIYSDKEADMYEANLMRRLGGLLYIDSNMMGAIKDKIKNKITK